MCACKKRAYSSRARAREVVRRMRGTGESPQNSHGRLMPYRCEGGEWHVGHSEMGTLEFFRTRRVA